MYISRIKVENYRLLKDVEMKVDKDKTLIVGRNNSGKTSMSELFRRLIEDKKFSFTLDDFTISSYSKFWEAYYLYRIEQEHGAVSSVIPSINLTLSVNYSENQDDYGVLSEFIIDLNDDSDETSIKISYKLKDGNVPKIFHDFAIEGDIQETPTGIQRQEFLKKLRTSLEKNYETVLVCFDPANPANSKNLDFKDLEKIMWGGFVSAQRGISDITHKDNDVLGKVLENVFRSKSEIDERVGTAAVTTRLKEATETIQNEVNNNFNNDLLQIVPGVALWGYPGIGSPSIVTETIFDVAKLLNNHTKIRYVFENDCSLPEPYNGLGNRNLFYIYLKLFESFVEYKSKEIQPCSHLIFIEEPEAHLHPQMQEEFIKQLGKVKELFETEYNEGHPWRAQFVITSHSSHIVAKADFEQIRYFKPKRSEQNNDTQTNVKDLSEGLRGNGFIQDRAFLFQYLSLTKCDLFFADKAILIEGTTERILLPKIFERFDDMPNQEHKIRGQYITTIEVGGAYAHKFYDLVNFLELPTLIITDIDSVVEAGGTKCKVSQGTRTSNSCIKEWFESQVTPNQLIQKPSDEKLKSNLRLSYQIPEAGEAICGRSFEDAFILANKGIFNLESSEDLEEDVWTKTKNIKKTDFALTYAIETPEWNIPKYILEGLEWIAGATGITVEPDEAEAAIEAETETGEM